MRAFASSSRTPSPDHTVTTQSRACAASLLCTSHSPLSALFNPPFFLAVCRILKSHLEPFFESKKAFQTLMRFLVLGVAQISMHLGSECGGPRGVAPVGQRFIDTGGKTGKVVRKTREQAFLAVRMIRRLLALAPVVACIASCLASGSAALCLHLSEGAAERGVAWVQPSSLIIVPGFGKALQPGIRGGRRSDGRLGGVGLNPLSMSGSRGAAATRGGSGGRGGGERGKGAAAGGRRGGRRGGGGGGRETADDLEDPADDDPEHPAVLKLPNGWEERVLFVSNEATAKQAEKWAMGLIEESESVGGGEGREEGGGTVCVGIDVEWR